MDQLLGFAVTAHMTQEAAEGLGFLVLNALLAAIVAASALGAMAAAACVAVFHRKGLWYLTPVFAIAFIPLVVFVIVVTLDAWDWPLWAGGLLLLVVVVAAPAVVYLVHRRDTKNDSR